jgi:hypothetical protein
MNSWNYKIEQAKKHNEELKLTIKTFFDNRPYEIGTKYEDKTNRLNYYLTKVDNTPNNLGLILGDIMQNLRSALDHIAYKLYIHNNPTITSASHIHFPIGKSLSDYEQRKGNKTKGIHIGAVKLIDSIKPYKGGNEDLYTLHALNNIDKHRMILTVGAFFENVDIGSLMSNHMRESFPDSSFPDMSLFVKPADILFPLKVGDVLLSDAPNAKPVPNMKFNLKIVVNEAGVVQGVEITELVSNSIQAVQSAINTLEPKLS